MVDARGRNWSQRYCRRRSRADRGRRLSTGSTAPRNCHIWECTPPARAASPVPTSPRDAMPSPSSSCRPHVAGAAGPLRSVPVQAVSSPRGEERRAIFTRTRHGAELRESFRMRHPNWNETLARVISFWRSLPAPLRPFEPQGALAPVTPSPGPFRRRQCRSSPPSATKASIAGCGGVHGGVRPE